MVTETFWADMRDNGFMLVDFPARAIAVFPNESWQVVIASHSDAATSITVLERQEVHSIALVLVAAAKAANVTGAAIDAEYGAHCVIQKAMGVAHE